MLFKDTPQSGYPRRPSPSPTHTPYRGGTFTLPFDHIVFHAVFILQKNKRCINLLYYIHNDIVFHAGCSLICRLEAEADYIGIMLLAAAGYDPQVAPKVCNKFADMERNKDYYGWRYDDCFRTHPPSKERSRLLSQHKVMGEALHLYREVTANQGHEKVLPDC
jgi:hypothetical protein